MTPDNIKLLIDTIGAVAMFAIFTGFTIWLIKYVCEEDGRDD